MKITDLLSKDAIKLNGIANSKQDAINKLVDLMAKNGNLTDKEKYTQVVLKREEEGSTGIGEFGQLFESIKRINLHMGTKRFNQAMAMLQTGVNDPERAEKLLKVKKVAIVGQGILGTLGGMAGQKKR